MLRSLILVVATTLALLLVICGYNAIAHLVFWAETEEVRFHSGEIELAGTLVKPQGNGPFPAVVMLHGSGREPRFDMTGRAVINELVGKGFAVLAYDKRGVGGSSGDFDSALYRDFIDDAMAAIDFVAARRDISGNRLGLYTVSESGWFGPEIATRRPSIRFIFNKVAPVLSRNETVAWEVRNEYIDAGVAPADAQLMVEQVSRRWAHYIAVAANPALATGPEREALQRDLDAFRSRLSQHAHLMPEVLWPYDAQDYAAFAADAAYDPTPFLKRLRIPQFYVYGGQDVNIPTDVCVATLEALSHSSGVDITVKVYPQLGHSLLGWKGVFHVGFPPDYLQILGNWTEAQANLD